MAQPLSPDLEAVILSALQAGSMSQGAIARQYGVHQSTISRIAHENDLVPTIHAMPKEAPEAKARWDTARRLGLLDKTFDKAETLLEDVGKPSELRDLQVAIGIGIDKARLESDLSTANVEVQGHLTIEQRQAIRQLLTGPS